MSMRRLVIERLSGLRDFNVNWANGMETAQKEMSAKIKVYEETLDEYSDVTLLDMLLRETINKQEYR